MNNDDVEIAPRVLLVTGGGTGIGAAVAQRAERDGWAVVITGRRPEPLAAVADGSDRIHPIAADMSQEPDVDRVVGEVISRFGRLDAVVANAGVMADGTVADTTPDAWAQVLSVNLTGAFLLARAVLPHLRASRGSFVGVGSIAGLRAPAGAAAYAVSKAGLAMLVRALAVEEGPAGVRANVVCPGWVRTEMADEEMDAFGGPLGLDREQAYAEVTGLVPLRRPAEAAEVASAVLWLAGPESSYVNGATLTVDGGTTQVDPGTVPFDVAVVPRRERG